jgi:hypothetical protein
MRNLAIGAPAGVGCGPAGGSDQGSGFAWISFAVAERAIKPSGEIVRLHNRGYGWKRNNVSAKGK